MSNQESAKVINLTELSFADLSRIRAAKEREKKETLKSSQAQPQAQPQDTTVKNTTVKSTAVKNTVVEGVETLEGIGLRNDILVEKEYYRVPNPISDILYEALSLSLAEQSIYNRLYRLSYGYQRNWCRVGATALMRSCQIKSQKTVLKAIHELVEKGCVKIIEDAEGNPKGTVYRVFLPFEIGEVVKKYPDLNPNIIRFTTVKNTTVNFSETPVKNTTVKNTVVPSNPDLTQDSDTTVKNTTVKNTANILHSFKHINSTLSPQHFVESFYQGIGQAKISKKEREQAIKVFNSLKKDGFTDDEIVFAVEWTLQNVKDVRSFAIIERTIGQALSEREKILEQQALEEEREKEREAELEQRRRDEEESAKLEEYISNLSPAEREALEYQARDELIRKEQIKERFINSMVLSAKVREIVKREGILNGVKS